jgi:hypothetical protein
MGTVTLRHSGVTIEVPENEIAFYLRAGYVRVGKDGKTLEASVPEEIHHKGISSKRAERNKREEEEKVEEE